MKDGITGFLSDGKRLPSDAKKYPAYKELIQQLEDMETILPLVEMLADHSIKERHWTQLIELTGKEVPWESDTFKL